MRKALIALVALAVAGSGTWYYLSGGAEADAAAAAPGAGAARAGGAGGGAAGARGGRGGATMTVEIVGASRRELVDHITVVGNLIGQATVDVVPRVAGRLQSVPVRLGDRVSKGQLIAKMEDNDVREQVNQAEANLAVNRANVVSRENDLKVAQNSLARLQRSFDSGLVSKQNLEDSEARVNTATSQLEVSRAQVSQTQARLDELKITLSNTNVVSPVDGFVSKRNLDPGAFAGGNTVILSVVDLSTVRMVANLVEKDFKRVQAGVEAVVEVDAFPGESFRGQVSRVAPAFDPATRTASMEIEVPNPGYRLKPGMYARVRLTADRRSNALAVPRAAIVDLENRHGVYLAENDVAKFKDVKTGLSDGEWVEVVEGLDEGQRVVTTGALALRDGDRIVATGRGGRGGREGGRGSDRGGDRGGGQPPADGAAAGRSGRQ
jgi:RND family efflux transporter MFP subunit